ncbi:MAG: endolytic transglycosylase MltG [Candidatus Vogelbacteria bacterium]|nr:endolytic transglycosylase MltG [Candidatus Vogelbacteria bacterium]
MMSQRRLILWFLILTLIFWVWFFSPPASFPIGETIAISQGRTIAAVARDLAARRIIRWPSAFRAVLALRPGPGFVVAGDYYFAKPGNVWETAARLGRGDYGLTPIRVTFPEGAPVREMAAILAAALPDFDAAAFMAAALPDEGYLFPDTYFFPSTIKPDKIIARLRANFQDKIKPLASSVAASRRTLKQIIIMASLVEEEARLDEARRTIAGILWKRLDQGMPLQVDAVFPYIIGKNTFELDQDDLATSSPYNTYRFRGLPVGPITNPGLAAIEAVLNPVVTDYWYYLSDRRGQIHYAVDFDAHRANKTRYLP